MHIHYKYNFHFLREYFAVGKWVGPKVSGLDIETEGVLSPWDGTTATVQIELAEQVYVVHLDEKQTLAKVQGVDLFVRYLTCPDVLKVIHNAVFEHTFFIHELNKVRTAPVWDTQIAEYDLAEGRSIIGPDQYVTPDVDRPTQKLNLGDTVERWFGVQMDKDKDLRQSFRRGHLTPLTERQLAYAAFDAYYARLLQEKQAAAFAKRSQTLRDIFQMDCEHTYAVALMTVAGMPFDVDLANKTMADWQAEIESLDTAIRAGLYVPGDGEPIMTTRGKPSMHKGQPVIQNLKLLAAAAMVKRLNHHGYNVTSYESSDLKVYKDDPLIQAIMQYKKLYKLVNTYALPLPTYVKSSGRIHCHYKTTSTTTGRASVESPALQQIPSRTAEGRKIREFFRVKPGKKLVIADYSNIELRLVAEQFNDATMIRAFNDGIDLHHLTGAVVLYNITNPSWDVLMPKYREFLAAFEAGDPVVKKARQDAKALNFGLAYGAGAEKLQGLAWKDYDLKWTLAEAMAKREMWMTLYSGIRMYHREMSHKLNIYRNEGLVVETVEGRRRWVKGYSQALNHRIQGTSADMTKRAQISLAGKLNLVLAVHDELIAEVDEDDAEFAADLIKAAMVEAGEMYLKKVPCLVDVHIEESWKK